MKYLFSLISKIAILAVIISALFLSIRGLNSNPDPKTLNTPIWKENGPFELSPERGRFALLYSVVETKSVYFPVDIAKFITPDLGYKNGHFVSLFAPAVSYLAIPGYLLGKLLGISQVGAFSVIAIFALINTYLIKLIASKLGANKTASLVASLAFLFATPAFAYGVTLYQHHISTFLILMSVYILLRWNNFWSLTAIWFLCAASIPVDYPNLFLMFPIGIFALTRLYETKFQGNRILVSIKTIRFLSIISVLLPLSFFLWFNWKSYDNPLQFSGTIGSVGAIDEKGNPVVSKTQDLQNVEKYITPDEQKKSAVGFFHPRKIVNGIYIHLLSPDRGIIFFTPIVLFGIIGISCYKHKDKRILSVLVGIIAINIILYSMWGDPWGGWAFGSRYLIPSYAILSVLLALTLSKMGKSLFFLIPFWIVLTYSIGVNTLGALTTSTNPPQVEILELEKMSGKMERFSFDRNWEFLSTGKSKSFVFQTWGNKYLTSTQYYYFVSGMIILLSSGLLVAMYKNKYEK
jgi:hypothetical protein